MTPMEARNQLIKAKQQYHQSQISISELYEAADTYIKTLKEYKETHKIKRLLIPHRASLVR